MDADAPERKQSEQRDGRKGNIRGASCVERVPEYIALSSAVFKHFNSYVVCFTHTDLPLGGVKIILKNYILCKLMVL